MAQLYGKGYKKGGTLMRSYVAVSIASAALLLGACATPTTHEAMTVSQPAGFTIPDQLRGQVAVRDVIGGKETNPMLASSISSSAFEAALEGSLRNLGLGAPGRQMGRYLVAATIQNVEQPLMGFSMTVTTTVNYDVIERATNKTAWARTITRSYTAAAGAAFLGTERLRLASEGSAKANIEGFIDELVKSGLK